MSRGQQAAIVTVARTIGVVPHFLTPCPTGKRFFLNDLLMDDALGGIDVVVGRLIEAPLNIRKKSVSDTDLFLPLNIG